MKQQIGIVGSVAITIYVLAKSGVLDSLFIFLLAGAIPGTSWSVPAGIMLAIGIITAILIVVRCTAVAVFDELDLQRRTKKYLARKERMPKKRFRPLSR